MKKRATIRIGMPRVLNMYSQAPVFTGYFACARASSRRTSSSPITPPKSSTRKAPSADRSTLLPVEARHPARAQSAVRAPREEAARHHLLPDDRLPDRAISTGTAGHAAPARPWPQRRKPSRPPSPRKATCSRRRASSSSTRSSTSASRFVRAADVRRVQGHPGPVAGGEHASGRRKATGASITSTTSSCAARPAKCSSSWSAKTGSASCCSAGRITTTPA